MRPLPITFYILLAVGLTVGNIFIYRALLTPPLLQVSVFEVGKGHAALLRTPRGETVLIDTGSDASILRALGETLPEWQRAIDVVVLTSASANSVGGLPDVLRRYTIKDSFYFGAPTNDGEPLPYGTNLIIDTDTSATIIAPSTFNISYGATSLSISSSTPAGISISDGVSLRQK